MDLRNCSAAADASANPLANSSVAAPTRSNTAAGEPAPTFCAEAGGLARDGGFDESETGAILCARPAIFELFTRAMLVPTLSTAKQGSATARLGRAVAPNLDRKSLSGGYQGDEARHRDNCSN
jgi:hypothetical protein